MADATPENIPPLQRLLLAFVAFFFVLFRRDFALRVALLRQELRALPPGTTMSPAEASRPTAVPPVSKPAPPPVPAPAPPPPALAQKPAPEPAQKLAPEPPQKPAPAPAGVAAPKPAPTPSPAVPDERPALQLLGLLQREGRLVDFIEEDLHGFTDAQIGVAARTVHAGCKRAIEEHFRLEPVYRDPEGATVTVNGGFDPGAIRLTGNVVGSPPFRGSLRHHGWRVLEARLPKVAEGQDPRLVAPAEVEL